MDNSLQGTVRGKIVELTSDPGFEEGQRVEVVLRPVGGESGSRHTAAGMLADVPGLDETLQEIQQYRKHAQYRAESL